MSNEFESLAHDVLSKRLDALHADAHAFAEAHANDATKATRAKFAASVDALRAEFDKLGGA
jgi:hypothetical protein